MRLFLDANVLFAAAVTPAGRAQRLFDLAGAGLCVLVSTPYVLDEVRRNVHNRYPDALGKLGDLASKLEVTPEADVDLVAWAQEHLPAKDAPVLAAAVASRVDLLVTGDKRHFGALYDRELRGVRVVSLAGALWAILATPDNDDIDVDATSS